MRRGALGFLLVVGLLVACDGLAHADTSPEEVVLVGGDDALLAQFNAAFAPAGLVVVAAPAAAAPAAGMSLDAARALASAHGATAAIWLVPATDGRSTTLHVYDRGANRTLLHTLPYAPPMSESQHAEVSRVARTMLRALRGLPDGGVEKAPPRIAPPGDDTPTDVEPSSPPPRLAFELGVGLRMDSSNDTAGELRLGVGTAHGRWRFTVTGAFLASIDSHTGPFRGSVSDDGVALTARYAVPLGGKWQLLPGAGLDVDLVHVTGSSQGGGQSVASVDSWHVAPILRLETLAIYQVSRMVGLAAFVSIDLGLLRQRFTADDVVVYQLPRARFTLGLAVSLSFL